MNRFINLFKGEVHRLFKYNLIGASLFVSIIWLGILHFLPQDDISTIVPQLVFLDVTTMAMLLIGVTLIYEREENTLKTILISPVSKDEYILSKLIANILPSILSLTIIFLYGRFFKTMNINYINIFLGVVLVSFFHSLIGFILSYYARSFTDLLMLILLVFFIILLPVILDEFRIIDNEIFRKMVYILPTKSALMIIMGTAGIIEKGKIMLSLIYMTLGSAGLYFLNRRNFERYT